MLPSTLTNYRSLPSKKEKEAAVGQRRSDVTDSQDCDAQIPAWLIPLCDSIQIKSEKELNKIHSWLIKGDWKSLLTSHLPCFAFSSPPLGYSSSLMPHRDFSKTVITHGWSFSSPMYKRICKESSVSCWVSAKVLAWQFWEKSQRPHISWLLTFSHLCSSRQAGLQAVACL